MIPDIIAVFTLKLFISKKKYRNIFEILLLHCNSKNYHHAAIICFLFVLTDTFLLGEDNRSEKSIVSWTNIFRQLNVNLCNVAVAYIKAIPFESWGIKKHTCKNLGKFAAIGLSNTAIWECTKNYNAKFCVLIHFFLWRPETIISVRIINAWPTSAYSHHLYNKVTNNCFLLLMLTATSLWNIVKFCLFSKT